MMSSQIFGNLLGTFVLGRINNLVYFIILTILGCNFLDYCRCKCVLFHFFAISRGKVINIEGEFEAINGKGVGNNQGQEVHYLLFLLDTNT